MTQPGDLIVLGGGEHARVVVDAARSRPELWRVRGFVDPMPCEETSRRLSLPRLGEDDPKVAVDPSFRGCFFVMGVGGVGSANPRRELVVRSGIAPERWARVVHARATVSETAVLEPGVVIFAGAVVNSGARIGFQSIINSSAVVEHDVSLGAFTHVGPAAAIGGGTQLGEGCYLGLGSRVRDHVRLGRDVVVGMGSVVLASIPDGQTVVGAPARVFQPKSRVP